MLALISILLSLASSFTSLEVTSWTISNENRSIIVKNISSPVDVYSALYQSHLIDWPLKGYNDVLYRWIAYDNWTFTSLPFDISQFNQASLSLSNLDVYPQIILNDHILNITTSEFTSADIILSTKILKSTHNILQLKFLSPLLTAKVLSKVYNDTILPNCWPNIFHGECHINFLRKTQSSFGWDWGPAIPTMGIRGKVVINLTNSTYALIQGVRFITNADQSCKAWIAQVFVQINVMNADTKSDVCVTMNMEGLSVRRQKCVRTLNSGAYILDFNVTVDSSSLKLWWPYEMGTPSAYRLEVSVTNGSEVMNSLIKYVGFRKIELDQSIISKNLGRKFQFRINCKSFFIKGTNWVPRSYLSIEWKKKSYLEFLLNSVKDANINTIRIWGGGRPEMELFYLIADRLGIMVWHDLMFAGSLYPYDTKFYNEVRDEITDLLWNVQSHPSILVWAGNNEIELLIATGWYSSPMNPYNIATYYKTFYLFIKPLVESLDPYTPFVLSSPSNGIESENNKGVSVNPESLYFGDVHFYLYNGNLWDERSYPITRMTTEFGFQSFPSMNTWAMVTDTDEDFNPNGALMKHRQHHEGGFQQIKTTIIQYFGKIEPPGNNNYQIKYTWFSYLSQINQAMILKVHINRLRSNQCNITETGEGFTSGAMYWQLNDNWIAPSWSSIESNGQWKLAHYYVKAAFSVERIMLAVYDDLIIVRLITPLLNPQQKYGIILKCVFINKNLSSAEPKERIITTTNNQCNVETILMEKVSEFLKKCECINRKECIVTASLMKDQNKVSYDEVLLVKPKELRLRKEAIKETIKVKIERSESDLSTCTITLKQNFVHLFISLTTTSLGSFSHNGFHIFKREHNVTFYPWYYHTSDFYNCSALQVDVLSLNTLLSNDIEE